DPPLATSRTWASAQAQEVAFSPAAGGDNAGIGLAANRRHWRVAGTTLQRALSPPFAGEKAKSTSWRSQVLDFARGGISIQTITSSPQGSDAHRPLPRRHQYLRAHSVDVADHVVVPEPE